MDNKLRENFEDTRKYLEDTFDIINEYFQNLREKKVVHKKYPELRFKLNENGIELNDMIDIFKADISPYLSSASGPRYFGFVTGGSTPAATIADILTTAYDQNVSSEIGSIAGNLEKNTITILKDLLRIPSDFFGAFVSGATMANFVGLAVAREWMSESVADNGLFSLKPFKVLSACPHSSVYKSLSMLGIGKKQLDLVKKEKFRERVDLKDLEKKLDENKHDKMIVVANAGTVNTGDFDDISSIANLKKTYDFYLHIDAAFGGCAAISDRYKNLFDGIEYADSITVDAHKWLNVPYDSAIAFTKHRSLQLRVFQNNAPYLGEIEDTEDYLHFVPENSRRFRALSTFFSVMTYGRHSYKHIIENCCDLAKELGERIDASEEFRLLAETRLNIVCFTLNKNNLSMDLVRAFQEKIMEDGKFFLTPTVYNGRPAMRIALSNWMTVMDDINISWESMKHSFHSL